MTKKAPGTEQDRKADEVDKFEQLFAEFRAGQRSFLNRLEYKLNELPEKDIDIEDALQYVKLLCWRSNLTTKKYPAAYIKACLRNFVNKLYKQRLGVFENLHYLDSIDDREHWKKAELRSESTVERTMETAERINLAWAHLADNERILIEKVYWDGAGNTELYDYFVEKRFPGQILTGVQKVRFEAWVRQEKCRVTKKFRSLMRGPKL
jgi:DNA-directed RNA polymerase specialized sigma24 family protein